ncbi:MAG: pyridoxal-phosphate dependent enzyme [Bacillota bacterium]|jgi:D-cysteine desulfhydrase|nr:pyridoxal-phosphate dependent enzyme [Bacillota bacterium]
MQVSIRRFNKGDIGNKVRWINDERNNQYLHYDLPLEYDKTVRWFERVEGQSDRYDAIIEVDGRPVGLVGLLNIDQKNGKAEYYIAVGEQEYKGKGVASKASAMLLDYAFDQLDLNKVYLYTEVGNVAAQRLFERIGFEKEGLLKEDLRVDGKSLDRYLYGICRTDYRRGSVSHSVFSEATPMIEATIGLAGNRLFIKREDLLPFSFGGNKARKARYFFRDALAQGCDCVVTYGGSSSNHCRVVANMAALQGLSCYIVSPIEGNRPTNNSRITSLLKADYVMSSLSDVSSTIDALLQELRSEGMNPYFIPGGGHGRLGTQAYVDCYDEILCQEEKLGVRFDYIFFASGTGTTQAGLACGKAIHEDDKNIVGISIARKNPHGKQVIIDSVQDYMQHIGKEFTSRDSIIFIDDYVLEGYGSHNEQVLDAIEGVLLSDGIPLDATYTGKAFWGMREYLQSYEITNKNVLFIHTGGTPLFFDDLGELVGADKSQPR